MGRTFLVALVLLVASCARIPPGSEEIEAKKMEPVPGKSVVYIAQNPFGTEIYTAGLTLDDGTQITTYPGTFYRWVTTPGAHTIESTEGMLNASIKLQLEAGRIYYVEHWVTGTWGSTTDARLEAIDDKIGRRMVTTSRPCCD